MNPKSPNSTRPTQDISSARDQTLLEDSCAAVLLLNCPRAIPAKTQPVRVGVPFPEGWLADSSDFHLRDSRGRSIQTQQEVLAHWPDGSIRWLLTDFWNPESEGTTTELTIARQSKAEGDDSRSIEVSTDDESIVVETGAARFTIDRNVFFPLKRVQIVGDEPGDQDAGDQDATVLSLIDEQGQEHVPKIRQYDVEADGPLRTTLSFRGCFESLHGMRWRARMSFFAGTGLVEIQFTLHNSTRARHRGGLWDLGDANSTMFQDLTLSVARPFGNNVQNFWRNEPHQEWQEDEADVEIYQDSSGGDNWNGRNHVNAAGTIPTQFRGYQVKWSDRCDRGNRASPVVGATNGEQSVTVSVPEFWQQFPKCISTTKERIEIGLFPGRWNDLFELQGGEQKSHTIWLQFTGDGAEESSRLEWTHEPIRACCSPTWNESSNTIPFFSAEFMDRDARLKSLMEKALDGERSFFKKRETIDEYGWRNYGDVWADHERTYYSGPHDEPISHYNNQYDVVGGCVTQLMRSGNPIWFDILHPMARHVIDTDIYHTTEDRCVYNGGLFFHTDHYLDAATSSHRAYSVKNSPASSDYGGGPCNEHNYALGFLYYYYLTGDRDARQTVIDLAEWVISMDDGSQTVLGIVEETPTGRASCTMDVDYHGPGRGAGNSIQVLMAAWELTQKSEYLSTVQELIQRCIHPKDDIEARSLLDVEIRWSYTVFLTSLGLYLRQMELHGRFDKVYYHARDSLIHYAKWMREHERVYLDHPEILEFPTETWAAQDIRKSNVMFMASQYLGEEEATSMHARAVQISEKAWEGLLSRDTHDYTRPLALMMFEGARNCYYRQLANFAREIPESADELDFGEPNAFLSQKSLAKRKIRSLAGLASTLLGCLNVRRLARFLRAARKRR